LNTAIIRDFASILRIHIIAIAMTAALVFGHILTDRFALSVVIIGGLDWLLINLLNRVTDLKEDLVNGIRGTERIARHPNGALGAWVALLVGSFVFSVLVAPEITVWRLGVQAVGVGYSYRVVPTLRGLVRFKDLYFFKNFMSALLFVTTVFIYPLAVNGFAFAGESGPPSLGTLLVLIAFFVPFEITYEILYDMRDLDGDRAAGVPTYPVAHGLDTSARIINWLLVIASAAIALGFLAGFVGVRELLMIAAPVIQYLFYRPRFERGITTGECIGLTWIGAGLLLFWLVGTTLWDDAGLPGNIYLNL